MPDDVRHMSPASGRRPTMIKGLIPSLPERGKIKIGVKGRVMTSRKGNEFQPPQKLDHFLVTTLERGEDGNFVPDDTLMRRLGYKPTEIPVRLLYDDPALNFPTRYACFVGRLLWCSGDGEVATRLTDEPKQLADGARAEPREVACPCHRADPAYQGRDKCKMNGSLSALIEGAGGIGGVWKFRTTSYNSIVGIMSSLAFIRSLTGGLLANIPLKLRLQPKQATAPDGSQVVVYIVSVEFDGDMAELQTTAHGIALNRAKLHVSIEHIEEEAKRLLALAPPANAALPGDDTDDVIDEFYPEQAASELERPREPRPRIEDVDRTRAARRSASVPDADPGPGEAQSQEPAEETSADDGSVEGTPGDRVASADALSIVTADGEVFTAVTVEDLRHKWDELFDNPMSPDQIVGMWQDNPAVRALIYETFGSAAMDRSFARFDKARQEKRATAPGLLPGIGQVPGAPIDEQLTLAIDDGWGLKRVQSEFRRGLADIENLDPTLRKTTLERFRQLNGAVEIKLAQKDRAWLEQNVHPLYAQIGVRL